jgi:hypothetical protein
MPCFDFQAVGKVVQEAGLHAACGRNVLAHAVPQKPPYAVLMCVVLLSCVACVLRSGTVTLADFNDAPKSIMSWDSVTEGTQVRVWVCCTEHA